MAGTSSLPPPDAWQWHIAETYKGLITLSVEALKMVALVNGGAAVAVLTYLGNLAARGPSGKLPDLKAALIWYCAGLVAAVVAFLVAYLAQFRLFNEEVASREGKQVQAPHDLRHR